MNDHEVKFNITFQTAANCYISSTGSAPTSGTPSISYASLYIDYVYLDTDERRQFAQVQHIKMCLKINFKQVC